MESFQPKLKKFLKQSNEQYRLGKKESILSDEEYDQLLQLINDDIFKNQVGISVEKNKSPLPIKLGSLNKVKTQEEINDWIRLKEIPIEQDCIIMPKYDGLSLLVEFRNGVFHKAITRGNGNEGQDVTSHIQMNILSKIPLSKKISGYFIGEIILDLNTFETHFKEIFKNPRNTVAGLLGRKNLTKDLGLLKFIAFSFYNEYQEHSHINKQEELEFCNTQINYAFGYQLPYFKKKIAQLKNTNLEKILQKEKQFQCDGLVLEIDKLKLREDMGDETNSLNPSYARAWKPQQEKFASSIVKEVLWNVSKNYYLKPIIKIQAITLSGVEIQNITGNNASYIQKNKINTGAIVQFVRSGDVIPKIIGVHQPAEKFCLPQKCPNCTSSLTWNEQKVELLCTNKNHCPGQQIAQNKEFFKLMNIDAVGVGIVEQLFQLGYNSVEKILQLKIEELVEFNGFQETLAKKVYHSIREKIIDAPLTRVQHASNLFKLLGEKKLGLLEDYNKKHKKPSREILLTIDGIQEKTANAYLEGFDKFWIWLEKTPITIKKTVIKQSQFTGKSFIFTGFRDRQLEEQLVGLGAKIKSSMSKNIDTLICKNKDTSNNKLQKAKKLEIPILSLEEFLQKLNKIK